jgi:hypothetical protein
MTEHDHKLWLITVIQHLSYEIDEVSKVLSKTVKGDPIMRKAGHDDPGIVMMTPIEVRRMIVDSIGDSLNQFVEYNDRDRVDNVVRP